MDIGDQAPELRAAGHRRRAARRAEAPTVVVFTCNHCPYALAWHDRLMQVARDYVDVHFSRSTRTTPSATRATRSRR